MTSSTQRQALITEERGRWTGSRLGARRNNSLDTRRRIGDGASRKSRRKHPAQPKSGGANKANGTKRRTTCKKYMTAITKKRETISPAEKGCIASTSQEVKKRNSSKKKELEGMAHRTETPYQRLGHVRVNKQRGAFEKKKKNGLWERGHGMPIPPVALRAELDWGRSHRLGQRKTGPVKQRDGKTIR